MPRVLENIIRPSDLKSHKLEYTLSSCTTIDAGLATLCIYVHAYVWELSFNRAYFCCRRESSCHATRRYHGPEGDLHLHRCDITIVAPKVTVMTPVHFGPAI